MRRETSRNRCGERRPTKGNEASRPGLGPAAILAAALSIAAWGCAPDAVHTDSELAPSGHPNVLFIIVDDLRPELGAYGNQVIQTPNLDRFAAQGFTFVRAYSQAAACAPSRASVMQGLRPDTTRVWSLGESFREINPDAVTMPQHFSQYGYHTVSMGKIFHNHMPDRVSFDEPDLRPPAFATPELIDRDPESFYYDEALQEELAEVRARRLEANPNAYAGGWAYGRSWEAFDGPDEAFYDGAQTDLAIETLSRLAKKEQPFFLAVGYYRPHLPFVAPKKYWDLYDPDQIPMATNPYLPEDSPIMAMNSTYELGACYDLEDMVQHPSLGQLPEETARLLKHGYYASVSHVDSVIGKLLDGLDELGLSEDTIVVIWGDHGWKLGEHGSWCKQTNYDIDTRVPLMIRAPGVGPTGGRSSSLVELVDLFPTLSDLAGIPVPENMEGTSLRPILEAPDSVVKTAAFSQYVRRPKNSPDGHRYMGYAMVTDRYRYVEWYPWDQQTKTPGSRVAAELYDHRTDPDENVNVANRPGNEEIVQTLAAQLKSGWPAARSQKH